MYAIKKQLMSYLRHEDLLQASALVSRVTKPKVDTYTTVNRVMKIASDVLGDTPNLCSDPQMWVERINHVLFEKNGFPGKGNQYKNVIDDANLYLLEHLLTKKKGSALLYAILYRILLEQVGVDCEVIAFPSNYFFKIAGQDGDFYVDPFNKGALVTEAEFQRKLRGAMQRNRLLSANLFEKVTFSQLVGRQIQQLKHVYILKNDALKALRAVELLSTIYPESAELKRDRGILYCEMEYFSKARSDLHFYLRQCPKAEDVREIRKLTKMLKGYSETMN